jgi:hypothetical protein
MGENRSSAEGMKPTVSGPVGGAATTSPPLLATPGGVWSIHDVPSLGLRNTSQNVLLGSLSRPMARTIEDSAGVVAEAVIAIAGSLSAPALPGMPVLLDTATPTAAAPIAATATGQIIHFFMNA